MMEVPFFHDFHALHVFLVKVTNKVLTYKVNHLYRSMGKTTQSDLPKGRIQAIVNQSNFFVLIEMVLETILLWTRKRTEKAKI